MKYLQRSSHPLGYYAFELSSARLGYLIALLYEPQLDPSAAPLDTDSFIVFAVRIIQSNVNKIGVITSDKSVGHVQAMHFLGAIVFQFIKFE